MWFENRQHWVRDVTYSEDHSQIRTRTTASPRNLAISARRLTGRTNTAAALLHAAHDVNRLRHLGIRH